MSRRQAKEMRRAQFQRENDLRWMMADPRGRRVMQRLITDAGLGVASAMTGNSHTFYNLGRIDFVQRLLNELRMVSLADVRLMEDEAIVATQQAELESQPDDETPD